MKAPVGLVEIDLTERVVAANDRFLSWAGVAHADAVGQTVPELLTLRTSEFRAAVAAETGSSPILRRSDTSSGPDHVIISVARLEDGAAIVAIMDAARHYSSETSLRFSQRSYRHESERLTLLLDAAVSLANATSIEELSTLLAAAVRKAFDGTHASVHLLRDGVFVRTGGTNPLEARWPGSPAPPPGAYTAGRGKALIVTSPDNAEVHLPDRGIAGVLRDSGVHAVIVAPIMELGRALGAVACYFDHERGFDDQAEQLITALAQQAAAVFARLDLEESLRRAAMLDQITGLPNRRLFEQHLERSGTWATSPGAVLFIDLDGFKAVNDRLGHAAGDALLAEVAARLTTTHDTHDRVARYGGDEFVLFIENPDPDTINNAAEAIRAALAEPYPGLPSELTITASIGVAHRPDPADGYTVEQTIRRADHAMYEAKRLGGNTTAHN